MATSSSPKKPVTKRTRTTPNTPAPSRPGSDSGKFRIREAPDRGARKYEAPELPVTARIEAPDLGEGRNVLDDHHDFTHGRSQS